MKRWSIRKKSVNDEIIANEPRPVKNRSIKHIFKMNFLPITFLLYAVIIVAVVLLFMAGTADNQTAVEPNNGSTSGNTVTMTVEEYQNDADIDINWVTEPYYTKILSKLLDEGDTLIIQDIISEISYDSDRGITTVTFDTSNNPYNLVPEFEGDLTGSYQADDEVKITVTIKHVVFSYESAMGTMDFDMELFEEMWVSEEYYKTKADAGELGYKSLPQSCISKV